MLKNAAGTAAVDILGRAWGRGSLLHDYSAQLGAIVERRQSEAALLAAKQRAERHAREAREAMIEAQTANRAKSEFLANVSHELRTPLNAIIGFSELIQVMQVSSLEKIREYSRDINYSGNHLLDLINDILDLAKIEASSLPLNEEIVDLAQIARSCLMLVRERAQRATLELRADIAEQLPPYLADARRFKQIIINLLSNAIKFTPAKGTVTIALGLTESGAVRLRVADTGIGIAPENIANVLLPFTQVDSAYNRKHQGTGLGLPLTKAFVELHGGTFTVESALGRGTAATALFPSTRLQRQEP
jgi:signal transduction histidine kinase